MKSASTLGIALLAALLLASCQSTPVVDTNTYYITDLERYQEMMGHRGRRSRSRDTGPRRRLPAEVKRRPPTPRVVSENGPRVVSHRHARHGQDEAYYEKRPYHRPNSQLPIGKRTREGFVISPYTGARLPATNIPSGARILDPSSNKVFINP